MCFYTFYLTNLSLWVNGNIQLETNKETQQTQQTTSFHNFAPHMFWTLTRYQDSSFFSSLRNKVSHAWVRKGQKTESRMREKIITNKILRQFLLPCTQKLLLSWLVYIPLLGRKDLSWDHLNKTWREHIHCEDLRHIHPDMHHKNSFPANEI